MPQHAPTLRFSAHRRNQNVLINSLIIASIVFILNYKMNESGTKAAAGTPLIVVGCGSLLRPKSRHLKKFKNWRTSIELSIPTRTWPSRKTILRDACWVALKWSMFFRKNSTGSITPTERVNLLTFSSVRIRSNCSSSSPTKGSTNSVSLLIIKLLMID